MFTVHHLRLENLPDARALLRMGRAVVDLYCESFWQVQKRILPIRFAANHVAGCVQSPL